MDETFDFQELESWYDLVCTQRDEAQFTLLVYHQLICYFDADEVRERQAERLAYNELKVAAAELRQEIQVKQGELRQSQEVYPMATPTKRADTEKMIYRHNHISDHQWLLMSSDERQAWTSGMAKRTNKTVAA